MKIRKPTMKDAKRILQLLNSDANITTSDELHYNIEHVKEYILGKSFYTFVYIEDKKIVGVVMANVFKIGKYAELYNIIVDSNYRKKGIAKKLSDYIINYLEKKKIKLIFLYTEENNNPAQNLFQKLKFRKGKKLYFYFREMK